MSRLVRVIRKNSIYIPKDIAGKLWISEEVYLDLESSLTPSFLLPIVGIRIRGETGIHYTESNLFEISWKLSRIKYDPAEVKKGLLSIEKSFTRSPLRHLSVPRALELKRKGVQRFNRLNCYIVARDNNLMFLT
jgi:hypothetical protein